MNSLLAHIKKNYLLACLLVFFSYLFFYHLDYSTLASWDEAWYASIAREMARSHDFLHMIWDGHPYYDHPPMGFWLMALSYMAFGVSELTTRLPSAILGLGSILLIYMTGLALFGRRTVGFAAAVMLGTCVWYVVRVRSGNLDSIFVFFYLLTVYLSVRSSASMKWFPVAMAAFGALLLSKTLVGASAAAVVLVLNAHHLRSRSFVRYCAGGVVAFAIVVLPWYVSSFLTYPDFIHHHFFEIGTRSKSIWSYFRIHPTQPMFYLHMGVRKWYYLWILALVSLLITARARRWPYIVILVWNLIILYPFLTAEETQLWHLIPVYVPLALVTAVGLYDLLMAAADAVSRYLLPKRRPTILKHLKADDPWLQGAYVLAILFVAFLQVKTFRNEVFTGRYIADDVAISRSVRKYDRKTFLDDDFLPLAVYYSDKRLYKLYEMEGVGESADPNTLLKLFRSRETDFIAITRNWAVNQLDVAHVPYQILEKNNTFSIVSRP